MPILVQLASGKSQQNHSSDFQSRHPSKCEAEHCSLCIFVQEASDLVVLPSCNAAAPELSLANKNAWKTIQETQKSTREARFFISTGKKPSSTTGKLNSEIRQLCKKAKFDDKGA